MGFAGSIILLANHSARTLAPRRKGTLYFPDVRSAGDPDRSRHPASQHETKGTKVTSSHGPCPAERDAQMRVGFVGAGKIGFALGLHLRKSGVRISGYASRTDAAAAWAAQCTNSTPFESLQALLDASDIIFITVPDASIAQVGEEVAACLAGVHPTNAQLAGAQAGKIVCHCSGAATSDELRACREAGAACASVHPMVAVPDVPHGGAGDVAGAEPRGEAGTKPSTGKDAQLIPDRLANTFFTLEGDAKAVRTAEALLERAGNAHRVIDAADKVRYHAASVFMSNLVCGLAFEGLRLFQDCSFTADEALAAAGPLFSGNCDAITRRGPVEALSGPIERGDAGTVRAHLDALSGQALQTYATLSLSVCEAAKIRHPDRDYQPLEGLLKSALETPQSATAPASESPTHQAQTPS